MEFTKNICKKLAVCVCTLVLTGCASSPSWLPSTGPNYAQIQERQVGNGYPGIQIIDVTEPLAASLSKNDKKTLFSESFLSSGKTSYAIGPGDVLEVSIWEAVPAVLFGPAVADPRGATIANRATAFPGQTVGSDGTISIPFAGKIAAAGRSPQQIELEIVQRLKAKANQPQVLVQVAQNNTSNVTVVGEVTTSLRMPLTARGERILDALAAAGGVRQPVNKMTLQLTRGDNVKAMPLSTIIQDPKQNILLEPGDVITSISQAQSFTVLGATGKNEEVNFEAQGISLAQALARAGGLQDSRADAQGVFIFRLEPIGAAGLKGTVAKPTLDGKFPVVYRVDLKNPTSFFAAKSFPIQNGDVLYVSNAPGAELQKFLSIVVSFVYPIVNVSNALR